MEKTYGKWGMLRKTYLTNHKTELLKSLIANEELISHLNEIDEQAREMHELIVSRLAQRKPPPPQGTIEWVQHMNMLRLQADEFVLNDLIHN